MLHVCFWEKALSSGFMVTVITEWHLYISLRWIFSQQKVCMRSWFFSSLIGWTVRWSVEQLSFLQNWGSLSEDNRNPTCRNSWVCMNLSMMLRQDQVERVPIYKKWYFYLYCIFFWEKALSSRFIVTMITEWHLCASLRGIFSQQKVCKIMSFLTILIGRAVRWSVEQLSLLQKLGILIWGE